MPIIRYRHIVPWRPLPEELKRQKPPPPPPKPKSLPELIGMLVANKDVRKLGLSADILSACSEEFVRTLAKEMGVG